MTSRRLHRAPVLVLSRALVGSVLLEIVASPLACKPISTPAPARLSAHPLVSAGPPIGGEPLSTLRASTPGHGPLASAQSTSNTHFLARPQIEVGHDPAAPRVPSHGAVDHDRAAGWVTTRAPLKVLDDRRVSTSHCELIATDRGVLLRDLESKNGTYVNQVRLESGSSVYLSVDSRIRCGETWLEFRCAESERVPISRADSFGALVGRSVPMRRLYAQLTSLRSHELSVLITGETGTGKELVAQAIHRSSVRSGGPLIVVDCTTIPSSLAESMLFGHEKGAFTGAVSRHVSPFLAAHGGTLFFDELGELPLDIQPKLLRALETRQIQSVGSNRPVPIDVRVVAATRRNLHAEMNSKQFREDLYYRFAQVVVDMPPLRARAEDIADLSVRTKRLVVTEGKTPVLEREEARQLFAALDAAALGGDILALRDRAMFAMMLFGFVRVGALVKMQVRDFEDESAIAYLVLHEKGGKERRIPCHHQTREYLRAYIALAGFEPRARVALFQSAPRRSRSLSGRGLTEGKVWDAVKRRCRAAGLPSSITNHSFRATGITIHQENKGRLEDAQALAGHADARTTRLYVRAERKVAQAEVERVQL